VRLWMCCEVVDVLWGGPGCVVEESKLLVSVGMRGGG